MEWFTQLGNYLQFMPDTPALAFDMTVSGPSDEAFGYLLAYSMQNTAVGLEVYPPEGAMLPGGE